MSEEEKKAIELLKEIADVKSCVTGDDLFEEDALILLNLIDKQQKEIEYYKAQDTNKGKLLNTALNETKNNCISKDKVKEKIEEIGGMNEIADIEREIYNRNEYAIEMLLDLLEENKSNENNI